MNLEVIKSEKNELEASIDNMTVAEVLRVYLYEQGVELAAWRREHPSKPAVMHIKTSGKTVQKSVSDAIAAIKKDCDALLSAIKK
jgi:DNA-directed RNA polymerase subunit L